MPLIDDFRHTKIICTIGPATSSPARIRELILAGMDVARLNFSHGDHDTHRAILKTIRSVAKEENKVVGILQDLGGPKIRLGKIASDERLLQPDEMIILGTADEKDPAIIPVDYPHLLYDVSAGERILLADGTVELKVESVDKAHLIARVVVGGVIQSHKGINLPSTSLRIPSFTEKDRKDLSVGIEDGVDFVALSFVRHEEDLKPVKEIFADHKTRPMIIAKIEKPQAVERLEAILSEVDGVMVARGDLGVEMPLEEVPIIQKRVIYAARKAGKPVITATQMLRSMMDNPRPTRAEAADIANAVFDGSDALMLSDETAIGKYPVEAVAVLNRISKATEAHLIEFSHQDVSIKSLNRSTGSSIGGAACVIAEELSSPAIVAATTSGSTARLVARYRPSCPILAFTPEPSTERQLSISWGVAPVLVSSFKNVDEIYAMAMVWSRENNIARKGDRIVVTAGVPVGEPGTTNLLKVLEMD